MARSFLLQGILVCLTSLPLYFVFKDPKILKGGVLSVKNILAISMCLVGTLLETVADKQIQDFKDAKSRGERKEPLCRDGFWEKSRHPNLFFELVVWFGFGLYGSRVLIVQGSTDSRTHGAFSGLHFSSSS